MVQVFSVTHAGDFWQCGLRCTAARVSHDTYSHTVMKNVFFMTAIGVPGYKMFTKDMKIITDLNTCISS